LRNSASPRSVRGPGPPTYRRVTMRAIVLEKLGGLDSLVYKEIPEPEPKAGHVVIQIKAFGINHAEVHMRRGEWAEAAPVSGIECVGLVKSCPGGEFAVGAKVAALMGGLGRTINAATLSTLARRPRMSRLLSRICRGPSWRQFLKLTRPPGPVCSAISRSKRASFLSFAVPRRRSARPRSRWR